MSAPSRLLDSDEQPIVTREPRSFGGFMSKYWPMIVLAGTMVVNFVRTDERTNELNRRLTNAEAAMGTLATKADLARVEAGVTFLVQREMTKGTKP